VVVRIGAETETEALAEAGEDGAGEEGVFFALEDGGGSGAGALFEGLAEAEDGPAAAGAPAFGLLRKSGDCKADDRRSPGRG
jgi:hypothetical protein